jgi:phage anti-repressor protein
LLEKYFIIDTDYKVQTLLRQVAEQKDADDIDVDTRGGHNKEEIFLTINTFKKFCLKSGTKKADEVHDYFIKLEELLHETLDDESKELRNQLQSVERKFGDLHEKHFKLQENHKRILYKRVKHKLKRGGCVYIIKDRNKEVTEDGTCDYVFGNCKNLQSREQTYPV